MMVDVISCDGLAFCVVNSAQGRCAPLCITHGTFGPSLIEQVNHLPRFSRGSFRKSVDSVERPAMPLVSDYVLQ